jgi:hypothetical protein
MVNTCSTRDHGHMHVVEVTPKVGEPDQRVGKPHRRGASKAGAAQCRLRTRSPRGTRMRGRHRRPTETPVPSQHCFARRLTTPDDVGSCTPRRHTHPRPTAPPRSGAPENSRARGNAEPDPSRQVVTRTQCNGPHINEVAAIGGHWSPHSVAQSDRDPKVRAGRRRTRPWSSLLELIGGPHPGAHQCGQAAERLASLLGIRCAA